MNAHSRLAVIDWCLVYLRGCHGLLVRSMVMAVVVVVLLRVGVAVAAVVVVVLLRVGVAVAAVVVE